MYNVDNVATLWALPKISYFDFKPVDSVTWLFNIALFIFYVISPIQIKLQLKRIEIIFFNDKYAVTLNFTNDFVNFAFINLIVLLLAKLLLLWKGRLFYKNILLNLILTESFFPSLPLLWYSFNLTKMCLVFPGNKRTKCNTYWNLGPPPFFQR